MSEYLAQSQAFTATANAIRTKGGTTNTITWDENKGFADAVTGMTPVHVPESDINFWDYDGTLLYSWTLAELATKTELPPLPSHDGLICQGWNWTLADIKDAGREIDIGALYITDDGKTRIHINFDKYNWDAFKVNFWQSAYNAVVFDWGDGSNAESVAANSYQTVTHAYAESGRYTITMTTAVGKSARLGNANNDKTAFSTISDDDVYRNSMVEAIEVGDRMRLDDKAVLWCTSLKTLIIPKGVSVGTNRGFERCTNLKALVLSSAQSSLTQTFYYCSSLLALCPPKQLSDSIFSSRAFSHCRIVRIAVPDGTTSLGDAIFDGCSALRLVRLPDSVVSIGQSAFSSCFSVEEITGLDNVTVIGSHAFNSCYNLRRLDGLGSVNSIGAQAFKNCFSAKYYDFTACLAVPTLENANAFNGIRAGCEIRVPASLVDSWKAATNWSSLADHIVGV